MLTLARKFGACNAEIEPLLALLDVVPRNGDLDSWDVARADSVVVVPVAMDVALAVVAYPSVLRSLFTRTRSYHKP